MTFRQRLYQFMNATYDSGYYSAKMSQLDSKSEKYQEYQKLLDETIIKRREAKKALDLYDPANK